MRLRHTETEGEIFPELLDLLIHGWGSNLPNWDTPSDRLFDIWLFSEGELRDLARRHRDALQREAHRRGVAHPVYLGGPR